MMAVSHFYTLFYFYKHSYTLHSLLGRCKAFFDILYKDLEGERTALQRGPVGLLSMLPHEFTRDDVKALRIAQGMSPDPKRILNNWIARGHIEQRERGHYVKK